MKKAKKHVKGQFILPSPSTIWHPPPTVGPAQACHSRETVLPLLCSGPDVLPRGRGGRTAEPRGLAMYQRLERSAPP